MRRLICSCRFVDKAIKATVIGHLFGDESSLLNVSIDTTVREDQTEPGTLLLINVPVNSFVTTAPLSTGKGGDIDFSAFNSLL